MTLRKTGTRLTLEGASNYIGNMARASKANQDFGRSANESGKGLDIANVKSIALGTTIGGMLLGALNKGANALRALGSEALGAYVAQERLEQSMTSLVAKELRSKDATLEMAEAQELAGDRAEELLGWIQDLAIKSPFDQQGVAMAFRTALAYGFTTDEAQRLTAATIDYTTATGATGPVMDQVALALGQIKAKGKLAGQEMLQLVNAGINVRAMLDDMGYSADDVSKGLVTADEFMLKFVETMENDFGGAAARSSETMGGLLNSLADVKSIGLRELFGPVFEAALPHLSAFASKLQEMMPVVRLVGSYLGQITTFVINNREAIIKGTMVLGAFAAGFLLVTKATAILTAVTTILTAVVGGLAAVVGFLLSPIGLVAVAIGGLAALFVASFGKIQEKTGGFFSGMGTDLFDYGSNLILMLAKGMAAAMTAVLQVLTSIGQMITHWLSPGSPPKLLPNIDKWGTAAMQEFVGGMTGADMGVFKTLSGTLEGVIKSMMGDASAGDVNKQILAMRQSVMSAVGEFAQTGSVGEGTFKKIFDTLKIANPALQNYARELFNVQIAQQQLNDITKKYSDILGGHQAELDAIAKRRQEVIDGQRKEELEGILERATANGDALAIELAQMELREMAIKQQMALAEEARDTELAAAQDQLDSAQDRLDLQQDLIDAEIKNNELLQQQKDELDSAVGGGAAGGAGGAGALPTTPGEGIGGLLDGVGNAESGIGAALEGMKGRFEQFVKDLAAPFAGIKNELSLLTDAWSDTFITIGTRMGEFVGFMQGHWGAGGTWSGIMSMATQIIRTQWGSGGTWSGIIELLKTTVTLLQTHFFKIFGTSGSFPKMMLSATKFLLEQWGVGGLWENYMENLKGLITSVEEKFFEKLQNIMDKFLEVQDVMETFKTRLKNFKQWLEDNVFRFKIEAPQIPDWMVPGSPIKLHTALKGFKSFLDSTTFSPKMDFEQQAVNPVASAGAITNNYIYNQQQIQGVGQYAPQGTMDLNMLKSFIEKTIADAIGS